MDKRTPGVADRIRQRIISYAGMQTHRISAVVAIGELGLTYTLPEDQTSPKS